eukprot:1191251-Prorocentrum_minimum.AAC.2
MTLNDLGAQAVVAHSESVCGSVQALSLKHVYHSISNDFERPRGTSSSRSLGVRGSVQASSDGLPVSKAVAVNMHTSELFGTTESGSKKDTSGSSDSPKWRAMGADPSANHDEAVYENPVRHSTDVHS